MGLCGVVHLDETQDQHIQKSTDFVRRLRNSWRTAVIPSGRRNHGADAGNSGGPSFSPSRRAGVTDEMSDETLTENLGMPDGKRKRRHSLNEAKRRWYALHRSRRFRRRFWLLASKSSRPSVILAFPGTWPSDAPTDGIV